MTTELNRFTRIKALLQDTKLIDSHTISSVVAECDAVIFAQRPAAQEGEVDDGDVTGQPGPLPETGWDVVPAGAFRKPSPTAGMNLGERIKHVGGRENAAGYIEFGSVAAVRALVRQYLRDLPAPQQATPEPVGEPVAYREKLTGRLCEPKHTHRRKFPMCYEPLFTHPAPGVPDGFALVPMTEDQVWHNDSIMSANAIGGLKMDAVMRIVRGVEAHHSERLAAAQAKGGQA